MNFEHDLSCCFAVFVEKLLQNSHHKFHGCVVVIEHHHLVHLGWADLGGPSLQHNRIAAGWRTLGLHGNFGLLKGLGVLWFIGCHHLILSAREPKN